MEKERLTSDALLSAFDPPLPQEAPLRLEVNLHLSAQGSETPLHVALRVGMERLYVVRSLPSFLRALEKGEPIPFGKGFTLDPSSMRFEKADRRILSVLSEVEAAQRSCEAQGFRLPQNGKFMALCPQTALRLLRLLMARPFRLASGGEMLSCEPIARQTLPITCTLYENGCTLCASLRLPAGIVPVTADYEFVRLEPNLLAQLPPVQRRALRALAAYVDAAGHAEIAFSPRETERVVAEVLPQLEQACQVSLSPALSARVRRDPLSARVYVDRDRDRILARVAFRYGEAVVDPFAPSDKSDAGGALLVRDAQGEYAVLEALAHAGFHVGNGRIYLAGSQRVLRFLQEGVQALQRVASVYASEEFRRMRPRRPQLSGALTMAGGALQLTLLDGETPLEDLTGLMRALRDRKRYFRLRDGGFLDLTGLEGWEEVAGLLGDAGESDAPAADSARAEAAALSAAMPLQAYRAAYLVSLLEQSGLPVRVDESARQVADALHCPGEPCPAPLDRVLRPYQLRGFAWLQALYRLSMGGVLADDMGLGKTLQVIAAMLWAKRRDGAAPSLVVAPTSLVYNWQAELANFAPELSVAVIEGGQQARTARWTALKNAPDVDVIITSYPLLRRDVQLMAGLSFRFAVLDEAQHIKNPQSLAALAAGRLSARTRLALTGTPMENNPGELWSIFHFVLPGYLTTLPQFLRRHGDGSGADALRRQIRPFLLRRLKADVLPELPEKIEYRVLADMPPEQRRVYAAAALRLRERVERVLNEKGIGHGRMEVLSAITQLRQICCHPSLVLEGYTGSSGKLDAMMEVLSGALLSGRRLLLFSQFTSMLAILRRVLEAGGVRTLYLDGKTPTGQRLELVNRFNAGEGQVFLISLKAGGAGLNLTGADTVVHYDPWWNPAAEDQATDRVHRIGQERSVQVIRLITRGTIEEQVARLSERKRALFDAVVTAGEMMPSDLTREEIMGLFA
ncbi:MAG: DEAD/DEAH box helicase [Christensenellales bacterium]|uniref:DEAD/DEAH box helicase n=1 Tax=Candidatus Avichristensenella intestinipullorum TaxID=2840693 RepID=A0A9D0YUJ1_9FIRM|nr:DEAD/DEAH box helicase [Christensenellales bacterium]HIQ62372.1 DEAD/DEAH box helicase [Candidatus Avichristensenella intestinipullorum]